MEAFVDDSKIFRPYMHTLSHLASVRVAAPLCNVFDLKTLRKASFNIGEGSSCQDSDDPLELKCNRAQQSFLLIPPPLRKTVIDTAIGMNHAAYVWRIRQGNFVNHRIDYVFYWKCDGTVDAVKTAHHLALNTNFDVKERFNLACQFCLEEDIRTLWPEVESSDEIKYLESRFSIVRFWVRRMINGCRIPWKQDGRDFFRDCFEDTRMGARFSAFLPLFPAEERRRFFDSLRLADVEDYMLCLNAMSKEEETEILQKDLLWRILFFYLRSPLRFLLLETAQKLWKFMQETDFKRFMDRLLELRTPWEDIDYYELIESFLDCSPVHLRESIRAYPRTAREIDSCLVELERKRKENLEKQKRFLNLFQTQKDQKS